MNSPADRSMPALDTIPAPPERPRKSELFRGGYGSLVVIVLLLAGFAVSAAASPAAATPYRGKTKGGTAVTFKLAGSQLKRMRTLVPTICVETTGTYASRAGAELYRPPKATLGRKVKSKALQPAALNQGIKATKNYTVEAHRSGRKVKGKLSLNYSFLIPDLYGAKIFICSGSTSFTAAPR